MGGFRADFGWIWGGLELICVGCAAGQVGMWLCNLERCPKPPKLAHNSRWRVFLEITTQPWNLTSWEPKDSSHFQRAARYARRGGRRLFFPVAPRSRAPVPRSEKAKKKAPVLRGKTHDAEVAPLFPQQLKAKGSQPR